MKIKISFATAILLAMAPLGISYGSELESDNAYRLTSGDRVVVTVFGHDDLSGEFDVSAENVISMPLIPEILAAGLTVNELEEAIVDALRPDYLKNPKVSIEIVNLRPFYIMGEVSNPGSYPFTNDMTVMIAVAVAGGFTYRANKKEAIIRRTVDDEIIDMEVEMSTIVQPGDAIEVRERFF